MALTKKTYINTELEWAETQLEAWRSYVDANLLHTLVDRVQYKETKGGGVMPMIVATIEAQGKFVQETMKNYLSLLEVVDDLRNKEEAKKQARGKEEVPHRML
jgi:hypothetical protein